MSEQQPQQEPWTRPPAEGEPGARAGQSDAEPAGAVPPQPPLPRRRPVPPQPYLGPAYQAPPQGWVPPQPAPTVAVDPRRRVRRIAVGGGAAAVIAAALAVAIATQGGPTTETSALTESTGSSGSGSSSVTDPGSSSDFGGRGMPSGRGGHVGGLPGGAYGGFGGSGSSSGTAQLSGATPATTAEETGVVTIDATLGYESATSAGTGMILSSDGLVLTNNHVVDGATAIQVTDESTGRQYTATVVGTDPSADVALLQLTDASGLTPVTLDNDGGVANGDDITAVGNAEGTGDLVAADGAVTGTDQTMTAQTETGAAAETLDGLIEFQAAVVAGDSGGPVLDSEGEVVGMTTAASDGPGATIAYAITIEDALAVAHQIESGSTADGVTIGYPAFLGVAFSSGSSFPGLGFGTGGAGLGTASGATIAGVIDGTPAASIGLAEGDTITTIDGTAVSSSDDLSAALATHKPGDRVTITWVSGSTGASSSATVTLMAGPAN